MPEGKGRGEFVRRCWDMIAPHGGSLVDRVVTGSAVAAARSAQGADGEEGDALRDNAWFVGLAPRRNPEIVVVVLYQSGEHGYLAAPLARDVIKAYFDKKKGIQPQLANREEPGAQPAALAPSGRVGG